MEIPFARLLLNDSRLLEQVVKDDAAHRISLVVKFNVHELAEPTRIVVPIRLCVAKGLQDRIRLQKNVLDSVIIVINFI